MGWAEFSWSRWRILEKFRPPDDGWDEDIGQRSWKHYRGRLFICCQTIGQGDDEGIGREEGRTQNNKLVVEYPIVNVMGVSKLWNGALRI